MVKVISATDECIVDQQKNCFHKKYVLSAFSESVFSAVSQKNARGGPGVVVTAVARDLAGLRTQARPLILATGRIRRPHWFAGNRFNSSFYTIMFESR